MASLSCTVLSTPACNCCINDLHRAAPKRHFAPPQDPMVALWVVLFFYTLTAADPPHRVSCDAYGARRIGHGQAQSMLQW